jgi:hypothetical protein
MKKTTAATNQKATKIPATAAPAQEAATAASQPKKPTPAARKAKAAKPAKKAGSNKVAAAQEAGTTKKDQVLAMISRKNGATLAEIMTATGWQKHTVRGFISIVGKAGTKIDSSKTEAGARTYKAA